MSKVIAAINLTIDGYCDHTDMEPDEEIHMHYAELLRNSSVILYGRTTYQLMEFWKSLVEKPSGVKSMDDFAIEMDKVPKIVFSRTLNQLDWDSASLSDLTPEEVIKQLRNQDNQIISIGSRSLIVQLTNSKLIDEFQFCIHPVLAGKGLKLFEGLNSRMTLRLVSTKKFSRGAVMHTYVPE